MVATALTVLLTTLLTSCGAMNDEPAPDDKATKPEGAVKVDVQAKRIEVSGRFCLEEGILDYFAVTFGGQEYESVVSMDCKGSVLHAGLLAIGAAPGPTESMLRELRRTPPEDVKAKIPEKAGTALRITLEWEQDGKTVSMPARSLLFNRATRKAQDQGDWIFTGSFFATAPQDKTEYYMADIDLNLVAVVPSPSAVINFSADAGNPYTGENEGYEINREVAPKRDTPVKLVITLAEQPKPE
jgi:hypothetical protein